MKIYIDSDCKCHVKAAEGLTAFEVPFFDGKCSKFIEGYRYVPADTIWVRSDGEEFKGEMIAPFVDYALLAAYQAMYEEMLAQLTTTQAELTDADEALAELGVEVDG